LESIDACTDHHFVGVSLGSQIGDFAQEQDQRFGIVGVEDAGKRFAERELTFDADLRRAVIAVEFRGNVGKGVAAEDEAALTPGGGFGRVGPGEPGDFPIGCDARFLARGRR
jgi:hypothetical protein